MSLLSVVTKAQQLDTEEKEENLQESQLLPKTPSKPIVSNVSSNPDDSDLSNQLISNVSSSASLPLMGLSQSSILSSGLGQESHVNIDSDTYQLNLDVRQFTPEEISIKAVDGYLVIEAGHIDEVEENASVIRRFAARYALPAGCNTDALTSFINSDGMLTVSAPIIEMANEQEHLTLQETLFDESIVKTRSSHSERDPIRAMFDATNI